MKDWRVKTHSFLFWQTFFCFFEPMVSHKFHEIKIPLFLSLSSNPGALLNHFPALYSPSSKYFIYLIFKRLFMPAHPLCHFSAAALRRVQGSRQSRESTGWVRGFTQRVEDSIFPKKTGAVIWVEVMDVSVHTDRIGGSVGGERPLKAKWTKSSSFECSSAYTLSDVL